MKRKENAIFWNNFFMPYCHRQTSFSKVYSFISSHLFMLKAFITSNNKIKKIEWTSQNFTKDDLMYEKERKEKREKNLSFLFKGLRPEHFHYFSSFEMINLLGKEKYKLKTVMGNFRNVICYALLPYKMYQHNSYPEGCITWTINWFLVKKMNFVA